jgi:hypothetical protein
MSSPSNNMKCGHFKIVECKKRRRPFGDLGTDASIFVKCTLDEGVKAQSGFN